MKWTKASERLPEKDGSYCIKNIETGWIRGIFYRITGRSILRTRKAEWMWLDEGVAFHDPLPDEQALKDEAEELYPGNATLDKRDACSVTYGEIFAGYRAAYLEGCRRTLERVKELEDLLERRTLERDSLEEELALYKMEK